MHFIHGIELSEAFFSEIVGPILHNNFANLSYSAGLLGYGSDVLGFDDPMSTDHNWGPRVLLFLDDEDRQLVPEINNALKSKLPPTFAGYSTNFTPKREDQTQSMRPATGSEINHLVEIHGIDEYFRRALQSDVHRLTTAEWLRVPEQVLLELTAGKVFRDDLQKLDHYRQILSYYPLEVRKLRLAAYWDCIANEEAFVGRMVEFDDSVGARLLTGRLVTCLMKICFVIRKQYSPYSKWLSRAFNELGLPQIADKMRVVLHESDTGAIESRLGELYSLVLELQNESGDYPVAETKTTHYYNRPYEVINAGRIVKALRDSFNEPPSRELELASVALDGKLVSIDFTGTDLLRRAIGE